MLTLFRQRNASLLQRKTLNNDERLLGFDDDETTWTTNLSGVNFSGMLSFSSSVNVGTSQYPIYYPGASVAITSIPITWPTSPAPHLPAVNGLGWTATTTGNNAHFSKVQTVASVTNGPYTATWKLEINRLAMTVGYANIKWAPLYCIARVDGVTQSSSKTFHMQRVITDWEDTGVFGDYERLNGTSSSLIVFSASGTATIS